MNPNRLAGRPVARFRSRAGAWHARRSARSGGSRFGRILFGVLFCLGSVVEGSAQSSTAKGWVVGLGFGRAAVSFESDPGDGAALVHLWIGHALNGIVTPYLGGAYADIESRGLEAFDRMTFEHVDLGVRLNLANGRRRWVPYGDLALTVWPVSDVLKNGKRTTDFRSMPTFSVGGGLAIYLSEAWALDVNVKAGRGTFKDVPAGNIAAGGMSMHLGNPLDLDAASVRLSVGFSWWP